MRLAMVTAYYNYRGGFWFPWPMILAQKLVLPVGQITFFALVGTHLGNQSLDFYLWGNAIAVSTVACVYVGWAMGNERQAGMLLYIVSSPANRLAVFFGRAAAYIGDGIARVVLGLIWAGLAFGVVIAPEHWAGILVIALTAALAASGAGLLIGALCYVILDATIIGNSFCFLVLLAGGANIPRETLPQALQTLGSALPVTRSIQAARELASGAGPTEIAPLLLGDLAVGLAYGLAGLVLFGLLETQARRRGALEGM